MRTNTKNIITKPSILQIIIGGVITTLKSRQAQKDSPTQIGKYKLLKNIKKNVSKSGFAIGIYQKHGKKYFIKTWQGKIRDLFYYSIMNEYRVSKLLYKKLNQIRSRVAVAKPIEFIKSQNSISAVYEYINAPDLSEQSPNVQRDCLQTILNTLETVTSLLSFKEKNEFTKRGKLYFLSSLPFIFLMSIFYNPDKIYQIVKASIYCFTQVLTLPSSNMTLAHRDLLPENVKIKDSTVYLLDLESMALTIPYYDISNLYIYFKEVLKDDEAMQKDALFKYLLNHISVHRSADKEPTNFYRSYLASI